jgi:hypothetical protein
LAVDVAEDAKAEFGVLVEDFALRDVVAEMRLDEIVVLQHLLDQHTHLLPSLDTRILLEDPPAFGRKLFEAISHLTNSLVALEVADSCLQPTRDNNRKRGRTAKPARRAA